MDYDTTAWKHAQISICGGAWFGVIRIRLWLDDSTSKTFWHLILGKVSIGVSVPAWFANRYCGIPDRIELPVLAGSIGDAAPLVKSPAYESGCFELPGVWDANSERDARRGTGEADGGPR